MRIKNLRFILQGLATYIPFRIPWMPRHQVQFIENRVRAAGDYKTVARACYTNWLRFFITARPQSIESVAEIGPGDCLGVGLAALICGSKNYYPIDTYPRSRNFNNVLIFDELVRLFENRTPIPDDPEFPKAIPKLKSYEFPPALVIDKSRLQTIRNMIPDLERHEARDTPKVDFLFSVAVMEHVENPDEAYRRDYAYLKNGGIFAHAIGLNAHGTAARWNGHWTYSPFIWRLIKGRTKYLVNRWPHSWHVKSLQTRGFHVMLDETYRSENNLSRKDLNALFAHVPDDDLTICAAFMSGYK